MVIFSNTISSLARDSHANTLTLAALPDLGSATYRAFTVHHMEWLHFLSHADLNEVPVGQRFVAFLHDTV